MAPRSSSKSAIQNIDNVDVDLQFEQDENTTWVNKDKFPEFHNAYDDSQETSSLNESSRVQLRVKTTHRVPGDPDKKEITKSAFIPETTIYGGTNGVKLFIKKRRNHGLRL